MQFSGIITVQYRFYIPYRDSNYLYTESHLNQFSGLPRCEKAANRLRKKLIYSISSRADIARRKEASSSGRDTSLIGALMADGVVKFSSGVRTPSIT